MNDDDIDDLKALARKVVQMAYEEYPSVVAHCPAIANLQAAYLRIEKEEWGPDDHDLVGDWTVLLTDAFVTQEADFEVKSLQNVDSAK